MTTEDKLLDQAAKARADAIEAQRIADDADKSPEQKKADDAAQKADDLRAKASEATAKASAESQKPMTVEEAGVLVVAPPGTLAGDHLAQKFGNDPSNPQPAPGIDMEANLVKLSRKTPDVKDGLVYCEVPKEMVGDYERAGWNRA